MRLSPSRRKSVSTGNPPLVRWPVRRGACRRAGASAVLEPAALGTVARHPGQWLPVWQEACAEARPDACRYTSRPSSRATAPAGRAGRATRLAFFWRSRVAAALAGRGLSCVRRFRHQAAERGAGPAIGPAHDGHGHAGESEHEDERTVHGGRLQGHGSAICRREIARSALSAAAGPTRPPNIPPPPPPPRPLPPPPGK